MISPMNASLTGIRSSLEMMTVSASNVANSSTDEFKKDIVSFAEADQGGVTATVQKSAESGPRYPAEDGHLVEGSNVNYAEEAVQQIIAKYTLAANISVLKTSDEMHKSLLDILA